MQTRSHLGLCLTSFTLLLLGCALAEGCGGSDGGPSRPGSGGKSGTGGTVATDGGSTGGSGGSSDAASAQDVVLPSSDCYLVGLKLSGSINTEVNAPSPVVCAATYSDGFPVDVGFDVLVDNPVDGDDLMSFTLSINTTPAELPGAGLPGSVKLDLASLYLNTPDDSCSVDITHYAPLGGTSLGVDIEGSATCPMPATGNNGSATIAGTFYFKFIH